MKKLHFFIPILIALFFISPATHAQKTPQELGAFTFYCFKNDSLEDLFKKIPTIEEAAVLGESIGIVKGSPEFTAFTERYPVVVKEFKSICVEMRADTLENNLSWENAQLTKVDTVTRQLPLDNSIPGSRLVSITIIKVYFTSNGKNYKLTIGDAGKYGADWKFGNNLKLKKED